VGRVSPILAATVDFFLELKNLIEAFEESAVEYALCGGVALAIHGVPRATQDIDLLVKPEDVNRLREVARRCGFVLESFPMDFASGVTIRRFTKIIEGKPLMLDALLVGGPLTGAWERRQAAEIEGGHVHVIARDDLIALKLAAGRPQDLVDVQRLQEAGRG
jgi:hypothetical protein